MEMVPFASLAIQDPCIVPTKPPRCQVIRCNMRRREPSTLFLGDDDDRDLHALQRTAIGTEL